MTPNRPDRYEPDLDPDIEQAYRRLMDRSDELATARLRVERLDVHAILSEPTLVTEEFMSNLASTEHASPELRNFADRVHSGECRWSEIEFRARPLPHEVAELKESPNFVWTWGGPAVTPPSPSPRQDADDDDYEPPQSWLR
ncbi:hypothetical protein [Aldersonia kunmingensis]|uniref:hypothetical protein n=1 Tax=Aldersonia kunmingensis TaxID=408066 RepID=UPI000829796F|nr:hypothetical protein [Aldersonia kunmingensis]